MATVTVVRTVRAPARDVLEVIADPHEFARAISGVTRLEFLSPVRSGMGTRYRQTRTMSGRDYTMDFEVTEYAPEDHVQIVNETHGVTWDSRFTAVAAGPGASTLEMRMVTSGGSLVRRLMMPLICLLIRRAVARDIDAVKAYCEAGRRA